MAHDDPRDAAAAPRGGASASTGAGPSGATGSGQPRRDRVSTTFPATPPEIASTVQASNFVATPQLAPTPPPTGRPHFRHRGGRVATLALCIAACLLVGGMVTYALFPWPCTITVNGATVDATVRTTLDDLVENGTVNPTPGDFLAIDGSLLGEDAGFPFEAQVNGAPEKDLKRTVADGDDIQITDGTNRVEDYVEERYVIYPPVRIEGVGAVHRFASTGTRGEGLRRTGVTSGIVVDEVIDEGTPETLERANVDTDEKVIALTFDDGPWKDQTAQILDVLEENGAKATFFTVGERIAGLEDVVRRAYEGGHQICTHSWDHASGSGQGVNLDFMSDEEQRAEIEQGLAAIAEATGAEASRVVRVPGGNLSENTARILSEFATAEIGWNVDTHDWKKPGANVIMERMLKAEPGDILLMHDGGGDRSQTIEALRAALPMLREAGYRFVTIDELMSYAS